MSTIALIPAYNEAERVAATVRALSTVAGVDRVLVIDDGSADRTAAVATDAGAEVLTLSHRSGKGAALQAGLDRVSETAGIVVLLDADLGRSASETSALLRPVVEGLADMTVATFPPPTRPAGFGFVVRLARWGIRRLSGFETAAPLSGQRALSRAAWTAATPFAPGFGVEVALTVRACRAGLRVLEVPTTMTHAATGRDVAGFAHRGRQFLAVARTLTGLALERHSSRVSGG